MKTCHSLLLAVAVALLFTGSLHAQNETETLGTNAGNSLQAGGNYNTLLGDFSGFLMTSGQKNTHIGSRAGGGYTYLEWIDWVNNGTPLPDIGGTASTGSNNVFVGAESGLRNLTGTNNTFVGTRSGFANKASDNTFIGNAAGEDNTTGVDNVFVGEQAGANNTTGSDNVFVGENAGFNNTSGDENTSVGNRSFNSNTAGWGNTSMGSEAGYDNSTGIKNTFVGWFSGGNNSTGILNTLIGAEAGTRTKHADFNTFVGAYAGNENNISSETDAANRNTAVGVLAGGANRTGEDNVMIGAFADSGDYFSMNQNDLRTNLSGSAQGATPAVGDIEVDRIVNIGSYGYTTGDDAVGIGYKNRSHGTGGIALGSQATCTHTQAIAIGYQAVSHGDHIAVIGNASTASIDPGADGVTALGSSAYRYANVHAETYQVAADASAPALIDFAADAGSENNDRWRINAADSGDLSIASYATGSYVEVLKVHNNGNATISGDLLVNSDARLKENIAPIGNALGLLENIQGHTYEWKPETGRAKGTHYGLIAQEVEAVIPELVREDQQSSIKSVNYQGFVPILITAVGELKQQNQAQQEQIDGMRKQFEENQQLLEQLIANNEANNGVLK